MIVATTSPVRLALISLLCFSVLFRLRCVRAQVNQTFQIYGIQNFNSNITKNMMLCQPARFDDVALQISSPVALNQSYWLATNDTRGIWQDGSFSTVFDMSISPHPRGTATVNSTSIVESLSFVVFYYPYRTVQLPCKNKGKFLCSLDGVMMAVIFDSPNNKVVFCTFSRGENNTYTVTHKDTVVSLNKSVVDLSPSNGNGTMLKHRVWIDFNAPSNENVLQVYIETPGSPKPVNPVLNVTTLPFNPDGVGNSSVFGGQASLMMDQIYFGFSGPQGNTTHNLNYVSSWTLTVEVIPKPQINRPLSSHSRAKIIILSSTVPATVFLILVTILWIYVLKKKQETDFLGEALRSLPGMPREFKYAELQKATDNFHNKNKLGRGGFGEVYKGKLVKEQTLVAVKRFLRETDQRGFLAELTIINRLRHRNLVRLLGWSHRNRKLLLVYEYMPNGSLDKHLFGSQDKKTLPWDHRYKILTDVASALHYLHNEYNQMVVHRDIKASNIMLDTNFNACLGDFGLARTIDNGCTSYFDCEIKGMPGTWGYMAPESLLMGKATRETDVYGFGAVILETISGYRPSTKIGRFSLLVDWVWALHKEGDSIVAIDSKLQGEYNPNEAHRLLLLALACSHPNPAARPNAHDILQVMSKSKAPPIVPSEKPAFAWPSISLNDDSQYCYDSSNMVEVPVSDKIPLIFSNDQCVDGESTKRSNT